MSATAFTVDFIDITALNKRISALADIDTNTLLAGIGAEVTDQTYQRIRRGKTAPDGSAWPEWSDDYAKTRGSQHSLLVGKEGSNSLYASIVWELQSDGEVWVGSDKKYAAAQNEGYPENNLPARQFLGLSDDDISDVQAMLDDFIDNHINEAFA